MSRPRGARSRIVGDSGAFRRAGERGEEESADDTLFLRENLQLTRAKLSLQASALSEAEKTIELLTEALSAAEKKAAAVAEQKDASQEHQGDAGTTAKS